MVKEYRKLSHSFEESKAENMSLKSSSIESNSDEFEDIDILKTELSKLQAENEMLKDETILHKLNENQKLASDKTGVGFNSSEFSEGETSTQSRSAYDKFNKMSFVKADMIYNCLESVKYDDQNSPKLSDNGKAGIGFTKPESFKPNWLKNRLDKDKAKAGQKPFVPNQSWRNSKKVKTGWKKTQPRRDSYGQNVKPRFNRSHNFSQTFVDPHTGKTGERLAYRLIELVNYINRGGADKKGESSSRGPQQPSDVQIRDSAVSGSAGRTPTFAQRVEIAQRRIVETVLDANRNAESLEREAAAERDRERRRREARLLKRRRS
ncbi:myosin-12 [Dorcoceras hygrometricum]|uniref:Myosin-12 n=1 Tax=Dorcoceras hygrometricum TaxID=472368 RepID=A0A2Z7AUC4_9LAMI|nr:myosin-12 [Dorcoceras hygrometricum]